MRLPTLLFGLAFTLAIAAPLAAQRNGSPPTSSANRDRRPPSPLPTARVIGAGLNPATELIDKRRKLGLDETTLAALRALEVEFNTSRAELFVRYDSLRAQVNMARNRMESGVTPSTQEQQVSRERMVVLVRVMQELRADRAEQVRQVLAALPEEKRAAAQEFLEAQVEDLARTLRRSGQEGNALAGGAPRDGNAPPTGRQRP